MKYDAFISYRHTPLDMEMAKKLHKGLETFHIPKAVQKKTGRKNIKRVFRDQEELPIGSDLDENISTALKESGYLIVVCSPNTPKSEWVCKEIDSFIQMHDRAHVLAMLIEGEPNESFPQQLLVDEKGTPVEPLAADVRGTDSKERNKKFKTELLRLVAAILEVNYDDLRQRHRERKIRKIASIVSGVAAAVAIAGIAFGLYSSNMASKMKKLADEKAVLADEKTKLAEDILAEYKDKQANQSRFYAQSSEALLEIGNRRAAVLVASQALPTQDNDRPYVPEAEYALSSALHAYDVGHDMEYDRTLEHDYTVISMNMSNDRSRLVTVDIGDNVTVWNTDDWSRIVRIDSKVDEKDYVLHVVNAYADANGIYIANEESFSIYDYSGELISENKNLEYIRDMYINEKDRLGYAISSTQTYVIDLETGKTKEVFVNDTEESFSGRCAYVEQSGILAVGHYEDFTENATVSFLGKESTKASLSQGYILDMCATPKGNVAVLTCNSDFLYDGVKDVRIDLVSVDGNILWSDALEVNAWNVMSFNAIVKAHSYTKDGAERNDIVAVCDRKGYTYDETTGEKIADVSLSGEAMTLNLAKDSGIGYVGYAAGNLAPVDFDEGKVYTDFDIKIDLEIRDVMLMSGKAAVSAMRSTDVYVVSYHEASDLKKVGEIESTVLEAVADDIDCYAVQSVDDIFIHYFYDSDGKLLYTFDKSESTVKGIAFTGDICVLADGDKIWFIDPVKATAEGVTYSSLGMEDSPYSMDVTDNGKYASFRGGLDVAVVDLTDRKCIYSAYMDYSIGNAVVSEDGSKLYISPKGGALQVVDIASDEAKEFEKEYRGLSNYSSNKYVELSGDGKYLAMCCMDGNVRLADTADLSTKATIPLQTKNNTFLRFIDGSRYLVLQGDDHKIRIWDIEKGAFAVSSDCYRNMEYVVFDKEDGLLAVGDGAQVFLFETNTYGLVAYVPYCKAYIKDKNRFVLESRYELFHTTYKDYATLLQEAKIQFPNTALTEEEKVKYNIE